MHNIKLTIEYDGTDYAGWQRQSSRQSAMSNSPHSKTIQETIEKTLQKILQEKIKLIGSGRTDAGVHAQGQVANFKTNSDIPLNKLQRALNGLLPDDIVITEIKKVGLNFHSCFDAKSKVYCYKILNSVHPCVFLRNTTYFYPYPLDIELMRKEARCLLGKHDFKAFCASGSNTKDKFCTIKHIAIKRINYKPSTINYKLKDSPLIVIGIKADGFLYNMARNIVGTLIEVGRNRFKKGELERVLLAKDRRMAGPTAPSKGLCLIDVKY